MIDEVVTVAFLTSLKSLLYPLDAHLVTILLVGAFPQTQPLRDCIRI